MTLGTRPVPPASRLAAPAGLASWASGESFAAALFRSSRGNSAVFRAALTSGSIIRAFARLLALGALTGAAVLLLIASITVCHFSSADLTITDASDQHEGPLCPRKRF